MQLPHVFCFLVSIARSIGGSRYVDSPEGWISSRYGVGPREAQAFLGELEKNGYGALDDSGSRFTLTSDAKLVAGKISAYLATRKRSEGTSPAVSTRTNIRPSSGPRSLEDFLEAASSYYREPASLFLSTSRKQPLATRRQVLMYLMKMDGGFSLPVIGHFMRRDHTTVLHACRLIEERRRTDLGVEADLAAIREYVAKI